jgi:hypothetical protein
MPDSATITCPNCQSDIPLGEAVSHRLRSELEAEFEKERQRLNSTIAEREAKLAAEKDTLDSRSRALGEEVSRRLEEERAKILEAAARDAAARSDLALKELQSRIDSQNAQLEAARSNELELRKKQRELEDAKAAMDLEVARKLDAERQRIAETARLQAAEAEALKLADKDNKIKVLTEQIAALQKRAEQGSMQAQGETLELAIEQNLRAAFPFDEIVEIKKGQRGADVLQRVRTNTGLECGAILWEAKRAAKWALDWPAKLKDDQRESLADLAVLVTTCPPAGIRGIGQHEGVWVCEHPFIGALAAALRQGIVASASLRLQQSNSDDKKTLLYEHLCSVGFRQNIEAIVDAFVALQAQLEAEKRAFAKQWSERQTQLEKAITRTAALYGGIQGITGREALPEIKTFALPG